MARGKKRPKPKITPPPEPTAPPPARVTITLPSDAGPFWPYRLAVLLLPIIVLWHRDNALYPAPYYADSWFYLGYFRNLLEYKRELFYGAYYGSRLSWILPGVLIHAPFSPVVANVVLHLGVQSTAALSFFSILRITSGVQSAFLSTLVFSVQPWLWGATGWDYPDGVGIAYSLLSMALLTSCAARPRGKWILFASGLSLAAMMYSHVFLGTLTPLLLLYYVGLAWAWRSTPFSESVRDLGLWAGAGFASLTVLFCSINYLLDGKFWFYGSSLARAGSMAKNFQFTRSIWFEHELAPWLWPAVAGCIVAIALIFTIAKRTEWRANAATLLFSAQILASALYMAILQGRGTTVLGHYPYVSYLLPFVFLVLGSACWPAVRTMKFRDFSLICGVAVMAFGALWYSPHAFWIPSSNASQWFAIAISACALAIALPLRMRSPGAWLAVVGFAAYTAVAIAQTTNLGGLDLHGNREQYKRVLQLSDKIDAVRKGRPVLFWFDRKEPAFHEFTALNSIYLLEVRQLGTDFPSGCNVPIDPGTMIVVLSQHENAGETARSMLADCLRPFGMHPALESVDAIKPGRPYIMALLSANNDASPNRGRLVKAFDLSRIQRANSKLPPRRDSQGLVVTTLPQFGAIAATLPLDLDAGLRTKLAVYLQARVTRGSVAFAILDSQQPKYLVERFLAPSSAATELILPLPIPPITGNLVVYNPRDVVSEVTIQRIEIREMP